jgi:glycosyltransferase involved in cell wall biosynthesis
MQKTVCIVTSLHPDYDARVYKHCLSVQRLGYRTVLVSYWKKTNMEDGIEFASFAPGRGGILGRFQVMARIWRFMRKIKADVYHFHDIDIVPMMTLWRILSGRPVVYDIHENYPEEMLYRYKLPGLVRRILSLGVRTAEAFCAFVVRNCVLVVDSQKKRFDRPGRNTIMIRNFASRNLADTVEPNHSDRPPAVILNASAYFENGVTLYLDVAEKVLAKRKDVIFYLVDRFPTRGTYREEVMERAGRPSLAEGVRFLPNVRPDRIMQNVNRGTIGACFDLRVPARIRALPTKLFEYMAASLPIVATDLPNATHYLTQAQCGLLGRPEDPQSLADAICRLLDNPQEAHDMGRRGHEAFLARYNWESQDSVYDGFYTRILDGRKKDDPQESA